jgi:Leucine-rich repeat (LRR) protein
LTFINCWDTRISSLLPLKGMRFYHLNFASTLVSDLSPLVGMPLTELLLADTPVSDLSPLKGMPLKLLGCEGTKVTNLSPLGGMPLTRLSIEDTPVSDRSSLNGISLTSISLTPKNITVGIEAIRQMKSLQTIGPHWNQQFPPDEFWKKYDAGEFNKPASTFDAPAFIQWMKDVAAMPAEKQVDAVSKKLQELNPGFDRKETHKIDGGVVTEFKFVTDNVADISPVRALVGLRKLTCNGSGSGKGILLDLSPLKGMPLTFLDCGWNPTFDLAPLQGMPLSDLLCGGTQISDLSPLKGMPLQSLDFDMTAVFDLSPLKAMPLTRLTCVMTNVSDLSPLKGMPLTALDFHQTRVSDLSPLTTMPLRFLASNDTPVSDLTPLKELHLALIHFTPKNITRGIDAIRQMKSLKSIGTCSSCNEFPPDEFWKKYDAGEFGKPPIAALGDPAFQQWMKEVATLPAEQQVDAVAKKLQELNPGFDGKITPRIEGGVVTEVQFVSDNVTDISPVRALAGLMGLACHGSGRGKGILSLLPLKGMTLTGLDFGRTKVTDLSPLEGMPLTDLRCRETPVSDLSPLKGMPLKLLGCEGTKINNLSPLGGMPLTRLSIEDTPVSDLSPLSGISLTSISLMPKNITKGIEAIRQMKSLQTIGPHWNQQFPSAEFWTKYDAGEFK